MHKRGGFRPAALLIHSTAVINTHTRASPHRLRLVVSRSKCPPLSPSPHANSFVLGTAVITTDTSIPKRKTKSNVRRADNLKGFQCESHS
jgi:hypothetical protein